MLSGTATQGAALGATVVPTASFESVQPINQAKFALVFAAWGLSVEGKAAAVPLARWYMPSLKALDSLIRYELFRTEPEHILPAIT